MAHPTCTSVLIVLRVHVRAVEGVFRIPSTIALLVWFTMQVVGMFCHHIWNCMDSCKWHA